MKVKTRVFQKELKAMEISNSYFIVLNSYFSW